MFQENPRSCFENVFNKFQNLGNRTFGKNGEDGRHDPSNQILKTLTEMRMQTLDNSDGYEWIIAINAHEMVINGVMTITMLVMVIADACGGSSPHPQTISQAICGYCDHLHLPKARQVEVKARIITMTFAVNSSC